MPWPSGTIAAVKLKDTLVTFIEGLRDRFPPRQHVTVAVGTGETRKAGISVAVYSRADDEAALSYHDGAGAVLEEQHAVSVDVRADQKAGGTEAAEALYSTIRSALTTASVSGTLIPAGIYDLRETAEEPKYGEVEFERPLHLTCNTETYL